MNIRIVNSEEHLYPKDWSWNDHHHDALYQLFYVLEGEAIFRVNNTEYNVKKNDILLLHPGVIHSMAKGITEIRTYEVFFELDENFLANLVRDNNKFKYSDETIKPLIDYLISIASSRNEEYMRCAEACLISMLAMVFAKYDINKEEVINSGFIDNTGLSSITIKALSYIDKHFNKNISLDIISKEVGCNKSYLCTLFKKETSMTINNYINAVRIHHAADLLSFSSGEIETICSMVGYKSIEQFNSKFKEYIGVPPRLYKKFSSVNLNYDRLVIEQSMSNSIIDAVAARVGNFG